MFDDGTFLPDGVTLENLAALSRDGARVAERRVCELSELADAAARFALELSLTGMRAGEILSLLADSFSELSADEVDSGLALHGAYSLLVCASDRAELSRLLVERLRGAGIPVTESELLAEERGGEVIAYVKNALADEAYDVFVQEMHSPRVTYSKSFREAADAVLGGDADYCLLPLEERGGARIAPTAELIYRRDLRINAVTPVFGFEGSANMKYALLSSHFYVPELEPDDEGYLELRLSADGGEGLSELLSVAELYGIRIYSIATERYDTEGETETLYSLVFKETGGGFAELLVYLMLFLPEFVAVGMYKNLE